MKNYLSPTVTQRQPQSFMGQAQGGITPRQPVNMQAGMQPPVNMHQNSQMNSQPPMIDYHSQHPADHPMRKLFAEYMQKMKGQPNPYWSNNHG